MLFFRNIKKILKFGKSQNANNQSSKNGVDKVFEFFSKKYLDFISESKIIAEKIKNLQKTNYELALRHIDRGNIKEAIFRLKIVRKYWPENYDAHLKLIYCYYLSDMDDYAQESEKYLLNLNIDYQNKIAEEKEKAKKLLIES